MDAARPVLLFDGECGFCVRCVRFLLTIDSARRLQFAPMQGKTAQAFLLLCGLPTRDFSSAILVPDWNRRAELAPLYLTDALLTAVRMLGGVGLVLAWLRFLPRGWRDALYGRVARWRYRFFGVGDIGALYAEFGAERFYR